MLNDLRVAARGLARSPALTLVIVATVGLGIGATTTIFAGVQAALLSPLPYQHAGRLVRIYTDAPPNVFRFSVADYLALSEQQTQFEQVAGYTERSMSVSDGTSADRVVGRVVTWNYFDLLGLTPALGAAFTAADGQPGAPPVVVVSRRFWQERLGARPDALNRQIRIDGVDHRVAGVLGDTGPLEERPLVFVAAQWTTPSRRGPFFITAIGRLRSESARGAAAEELRTINRRIFPIWRSSYQDDRATWSMMPLERHVVGDVSTRATLAVTAVALVWLIACVNASNLLLARLASRRRELAVRAALGASRARVLGHLLAESAWFGAGAAGLGALLAAGGIRLLRSAGWSYVPRASEIGSSGEVTVFFVAITAVSLLLFGLMPALHGTGESLDHALHGSSRTATAGSGARRLLVAGQFAIATPLLVLAVLLVATLQALQRVDLGFDPTNLVSGSLVLPAAQYTDQARIIAFWDELDRRARQVPGVAAVAFADSRPPQDAGNQNNFDLEEAPTPAGQSQPVCTWVAVSPGYFPLLGQRLLEGRLIDDRDRPDRPSVIVVDRAWAARYFPGQSVVGKRLKQGGCTECAWTTVVGVVSEVKYDGLEQANLGTVYYPLAMRGPHPIEFLSSRARYLLVRTDGDPAGVVPALRQTIRELDPQLPFSSVATVDQLVDASVALPRSLSWLAGSFAAIAVVLSLIGIYGVMTHFVQQRVREIGIRIALGGTPGTVHRMVVGGGLRIVSGGLLAGLIAALFLSRSVASLLFGVDADDPTIFLGVGVSLLLAALVACSVPAQRAARIEPADALRVE